MSNIILLPHPSNLIHMGKMEFRRKYTALLAKNTQKKRASNIISVPKSIWEELENLKCQWIYFCSKFDR